MQVMFIFLLLSGSLWSKLTVYTGKVFNSQATLSVTQPQIRSEWGERICRKRFKMRNQEKDLDQVATFVVNDTLFPDLSSEYCADKYQILTQFNQRLRLVSILVQFSVILSVPQNSVTHSSSDSSGLRRQQILTNNG